MSTAQKIKLNTLYYVEGAFEKAPDNYSLPAIEIFSATSNVTIRATTKPDFTGAVTSLPIETSTAAQGDVFVTEAGRSIAYLAFGCADTDAEILVSGFSLKEVPYYTVTSAALTEEGTGVGLGERIYVDGNAGDTQALLRLSSITRGILDSVTVTAAGDSLDDYAGVYDVIGAGEGGEVTLTSTSTTKYKIDGVTVTDGGTGYAADDVLTVAGSTGDTAGKIKVLTVDETTGEILTVQVTKAGEFAADIAGTLTFTGGTGSDAELTATSDTFHRYAIATATITEEGSGYEASFVVDMGDGAKLTYTANAESGEIEIESAGKFATDVSGTITLASGATVSVTATAQYK